MNGNNLGNIDLILRDARGRFLTETITLEFRNMELASLNFTQTVQIQGGILELKGVPAFPHGVWFVTILPQKYRFKQIFVDVPANGTATISETFFVDPAKVIPVFPTPAQYQSDPRWQPLMTGITPAVFGRLNNDEKAGLLNLFAKMSHPSAAGVFDQVIDIFQAKPARFFAKVNAALLSTVRGMPNRFHEVLGTLHNFPDGWERISEGGSFKTPDPTGNLQLTFAINAQEEMAIDADLDDHEGLEHAFDVIKHKLTGRDTHPYDIHEILVKFQNIDPGYDVA